jgi:hypothetical protein
MNRTPPENLNPEMSDRSFTPQVLLRQEPAEEEEEEEDEGDGKEPDDDDEDEGQDGYSE